MAIPNTRIPAPEVMKFTVDPFLLIIALYMCLIYLHFIYEYYCNRGDF